MEIDITLNGNPHRLASGTTLSSLLETLALPNQRIAVERNEEIVPRSQYPSCELMAGDRVEIVQAIGGG